MKLERFEVPGLAHYSFLVASQGQAAVVDPKRDIDTYLEYSSANSLRITHILETHIHADYASGALELAKATGAELWLSAYDAGEDFEYKFPHHEMRDGEDFRLGDVRISALFTPGHTPEHISFLVSDETRSKEPMLMLSGDFLFVGSLGRPDLLGEQAKLGLAEKLYESVFARITSLPDGLEIHPAHGAGSMCGSGMGDRPQTTLGFERKANLFFRVRDKQEFIQQILATVPPFPDYYRRMKRINSEGPKILGGIPGERAIPVDEFSQLATRKEAVVIDLRRPEAFGGAHVPGSFNIGQGPTFAMWAAWIIPYDRPILLVGDDSTDYEGARRGLIRVGLDDIVGCLKGGMRAWIEAGHEQGHVAQASVDELAARLTNGAYVLDVRTKNEWQSGHIRGAHYLMAGDLPKQLDQVPRDKPIYVICGSGYRSSIVTSILRQAGHSQAINVVGGMNAWRSRGLETVSGAA